MNRPIENRLLTLPRPFLNSIKVTTSMHHACCRECFLSFRIPRVTDRSDVCGAHENLSDVVDAVADMDHIDIFRVREIAVPVDTLADHVLWGGLVEDDIVEEGSETYETVELVEDV